MLKKEAYAAIRHDIDSGKDWIDLRSIKIIREMVEDTVEKINYSMPQWASANPLVRIAKVRIEVIEDET